MDPVLGVDGCRGGWIGAHVGRDVRWQLYPRAEDALRAPARAIAIDIPIGLPAAGPRRCDLAARQALGERRSTVFPAPVRATLAATSYAEACELSRRHAGRALSRQTYAILPRIAEVDAAVSPADDARVTEVHPELALRTLAGRDLPSKHTPRGVAARLAALTRWRADVLAALEQLPAGPRLDDAIDALAAAWSAQRWAAGGASVLPGGPPERDARGLAMRIVF